MKQQRIPDPSGNAGAGDSAGGPRPSGEDAPATAGPTPFGRGATLADRFRVVGRVGQGGMGEIYRAEDLKLGQEVALKFLPSAHAREPRRLQLLYKEVRLARQVSHPNICRVYDAGEVGGRTFISMELVEGEDLSKLLRRVGRFPAERAVWIARQLCAGLAAAHDRGVVHRDLKPANVMIDSRGQVRITDFGVAGFLHERTRAETAGTPAYMAPEQQEGHEVTPRSDIYALGLVLYELFTGRHAFGDGRPDVTTTPDPPSSVTEAIDPAVERVILRCLEPDPTHRPATALAVSAALPGSDPLADALAAGETPSPELVAASGKAGGLHGRAAGLCLAGVVAGLLGLAFAGNWVRTVGRNPDLLEPAVLENQARGVVEALGYGNWQAADTAAGFTEGGGAGAVRFWYRQGRAVLLPVRAGQIRVDWNDPPMVDRGMIGVMLDGQGDLVRFRAVAGKETRWKPVGSTKERPPERLLELAGLDDAGGWRPVESDWRPVLRADRAAKWVNEDGLVVRAAWWRGRPVYFDRTPADAGEPTGATMLPSRLYVTAGGGLALLSLLTFAGAGVLTWRNLRSGRCDPLGGFRLGATILLLQVLTWVFYARHDPSVGTEVRLLLPWVWVSTYVAICLAMIYLGLEPYVRRFWPDALVSSSRALRGRFTDPLVGRDLLVGAAAGTAWALMEAAAHAYTGTRMEAASGHLEELAVLMGAREAVGGMFGRAHLAVAIGLVSLMMVFALRLLLRKVWLVAPAFAVLWAVATHSGLTGSESWAGVAVRFLQDLTLVVILMRFGLLAGMAGPFAWYVLNWYPITAQVGAWHFSYGLFGLVVVGGMAAYGVSVAWKEGIAASARRSPRHREGSRRQPRALFI